MGMTEVSHCFPLNGNKDDPSVEGIDNLVKVYKQALSGIKMMGPTNFADVLKQCKRMVIDYCDSKTFHICLILTDGEIHDMKETIDEIAEISKNNLPLAIIIVGVGNEDFSSMVKLDGDELRLREGISDIVQFVNFQQVID